jgi:putative membrane protein
MFLSSAVAVAAGVILVPAALADDSPLNHTDKSFLQDSYKDGVTEIQSGEMAARKTGNPDVKAFAEKLVQDHRQANNELKAMADSKKVAVQGGESLQDTSKGKSLDAKVGGDFDKAFIDEQIKDHKKDIDAFQKEANDAKDTDVKNLANKLLPTLKEHLSMAESIQAKIGK